MDFTNFDERTKQVIKFAGLYAISLAILLIIFLPLMKGSSKPLPEQRLSPIATARDQEVLVADSILHQRLISLQDLDRKKAILFGDSSKSKAEDSIQLAIQRQELIMRNMLDSLGKGTSMDSSDRLHQTLDAFWSSLGDRQSLQAISDKLESKTPAGNSKQSLLEAKATLINKDIRIADLEEELQRLKSVQNAVGNTLVTYDSKPADPALKDALDELQNNYNKQMDINTRLRSTNDILNNQVESLSATVKENSTVGVKKLSGMERQIDDLNASLYFSTVDCNLSRVDINQIISNASQRRTLLKQAMDILNVLKNSENSSIQKRAKEKIEQLNKIASTVRD